MRSWRTTTAPGSSIYAYLLNNYWHTNYKADQEGRLTFRFVLRPYAREKAADTLRRVLRVGVEAFAATSLRRFSQDNEQPLLVRPVAAGSPILRAPFSVDGPDAVVSSVRYERAGAAFVLRLHNPSERQTSATIVSNDAGSGIRVEVAADDRKTTSVVGGRIVLKPFATAIVRIVRRTRGQKPVAHQGPGNKDAMSNESR